MKKVFKFIGLGLIGLLTFIFLFVLGVFLFGTSPTKYKDQETAYDWMKYLNDNVKVNEVIIPGSHDAGTVDMVWLGETQTFSISEQLAVGVRYFDIRVNKKDDKYVIFHDIINGVEFIPILESIKEFITENPSEFLLLDFQHFKGDSQTDVYNLLTEHLYNNDLLVSNNTDLDNLTYVSNLTVGEVRGKCIVFWGDNSLSSLINSSSYLFSRNNDLGTLTSMTLDSYYVSEYHKGNSESFISDALPDYIGRIKTKTTNEGNKGIFVLQCQLTDGALIFGPWSREQKHSNNVEKYLTDILESDDLNYLNVIMRDFLNYQKTYQIISMNYHKDTINNSQKEEFMNIYSLNK